MSKIEPGRRFVAAVGDSNDPVTWSGIPFHLLQALKETNPSWRGLPFAADGTAWMRRRLIWNARQVMTGDQRGGYQYSTRFLEKLWGPHRAEIQGGMVINCFQLYPPSVVADDSIEKWFFIDQTLTQLFEYYGEAERVGRCIAAEAVERERIGYESATAIFTHSDWAAEGVMGYGIDSKKVRTSVPGASLDLGQYRLWEAGQTQRSTDDLSSDGLRLVFVGKYWYRKGLDRLMRAFQIARRGGAQMSLTVIGCERGSLPEDVRDAEGVGWLGFIDKRRAFRSFVDAVASCDVGCLPSRAEAGGIALREFHALGLAVLATTTGGTPEHAFPPSSWLISETAGDQELAGMLVALANDRDAVRNAKAAAWTNRARFLYPATIRSMDLC
jgi:glycosyltransferase involved in cell wall biosynthesis